MPGKHRRRVSGDLTAFGDCYEGLLLYSRLAAAGQGYFLVRLLPLGVALRGFLPSPMVLAISLRR